jgi:hypothetical protein
MDRMNAKVWMGSIAMGALLPLHGLAATAGAPRVIAAMGKGRPVLQGDQEAVLFEHKGKGCLTHFWFGGNFKGVEDTRIRYYVDGEECPSIDMNLYLGHGIGFHDNHAPWANRYMGKIGRQNGIFNNYGIPFGKSIRVTAQRAPDADPNPLIWWIVRGTENGRVRVGPLVLPETARLKLIKNENRVVDYMKEFDLCDLKGRGAVYQVTIAGEGLGNGGLSYLEACIRAYLNGSKTPAMLASGLEDYFLGTYFFDTGLYYNDTAGLTHMDHGKKTFSAYRFHDDDPLFFDNGLRLTCRNGESQDGSMDGPPASAPQPVRYTTYTWVYQW